MPNAKRVNWRNPHPISAQSAGSAANRFSSWLAAERGDCDNQMLFFLNGGYRVIAHDRRGHGRSDLTDTGNDMDRYAQDVVEFVVHLDLQNAVHIDHSTGGGEVARYAARAENGRIAKAALLGAVLPIMLQTAANPDGINRDGVDVKLGMINDWWRQSMMGGAQARYDCIGAFSETDFSYDIKNLTMPVLFLHGEDDQIVPIANSAELAINLVSNGTLKTYPACRTGFLQRIPVLCILIYWRSSKADLQTTTSGRIYSPAFPLCPSQNLINCHRDDHRSREHVGWFRAHAGQRRVPDQPRQSGRAIFHPRHRHKVPRSRLRPTC